MNVTVAVAPAQTAAGLEEIVTTGGGITVIVTDPVCGFVQEGVPEEVMFTRLNTVVAEYVLVIDATPALLRLIV